MIVLDGLDPAKFVSVNKRLHHMARHALTGYWRPLGAAAVWSHYGHADEGCTWHHRAHITLTFRWPTRHHRDGHNYYAYVIKPLIDGMVDARLLPGDDDRYLVGPDVRRDPERGPHRITIDIKEI